jgi:hypothetical protein
MTFALQMVSALMEPVGMVGYVLCGLLLPRLWLALPAAIGWAGAMQLWEAAQAKAHHGFSALELLFPRLAVAMIVATLLSLAVEAWRMGRAERTRRASGDASFGIGASD